MTVDRNALAREMRQAVVLLLSTYDSLILADIAMRHIEAASRSIPAAAALLREAGWTVEEPKCETCLGERRIMSLFGDGGDIVTEPCPTCNGARKRP